MTRDGATGRMLAATGRFDVIILALSAPGLCGVELCRQIRAAGVTAPILICGAGGAVDDCVAGLDAGADDYLVKPFVVEELIARVHALGRRGQPIGPELLRRVH
jgi:DNA-binding response OmpR family regulator